MLTPQILNNRLKMEFNILNAICNWSFIASHIKVKFNWKYVACSFHQIHNNKKRNEKSIDYNDDVVLNIAHIGSAIFVLVIGRKERRRMKGMKKKKCWAIHAPNDAWSIIRFGIAFDRFHRDDQWPSCVHYDKKLNFLMIFCFSINRLTINDGAILGNRVSVYCTLYTRLLRY